MDEQEYEATYSEDLGDLDHYELILLAMKAFLYVKENKDDISDEQLLNDILGWFDIMTFTADLPELESVERAKVCDEDGEDEPPQQVH